MATQRALAGKRDKALREVKQHLGKKQWWEFRWRLWLAKRYYPVREEALSYPGAGWRVLRQLALELGKRLVKAISVVGTGQVEINDPKMLMATRLWQKENYAFHLAHLREFWGSFQFQSPPAPYRTLKPFGKVSYQPMTLLLRL